MAEIKPKLTIKLKQLKQIELYEYQKTHVDSLLKIMADSPFIFDFSMLGTGKTYTTSFIYKKFYSTQFKHIIVISPVSVKSKWILMENEYHMKIDKIISFSELRGVKFKQPKHGLLHRRDYTTQITMDDLITREIEKVDYTCTNEYETMVKEGLLLVIDEIQNIKNISLQLDACQALIKPITENKLNSRVILLSGSPIDKKEQIVHFFKLLDIMKSDRLSVYNPQTCLCMWRGMQEIENYCSLNFGTDEVQEIKRIYERSKMYTYSSRYFNDLDDYCFMLFQNFIVRNRSHSMDPVSLPTSIIKLNAYYYLNNEQDLDLLRKGIRLLSVATHFNEHTGMIHHGHDGIASLQAITRALILIETAKIHLFIRVAREALERNPNQKVVICVNYTETINDLIAGLSQYNPLKLDGSMNTKKRTNTISLFQQNDNKYRLLIANIIVCSSGIDLDDKFGNFPRLCLVNPNYSTITLYQLSHRFQRVDTKSVPIIHFVICRELSEIKILNALAKKSTIMKEITENQARCGVVFPGDYQTWEESAPCT